MSLHKPVLSETDYFQLQDVVRDEWNQAISDRRTLLTLKQKIDNAQIASERGVGANVVCLGATVVLGQTLDDAEVFKLVCPEEADIAAGRLSVIAPIGIAILGQRVGQTLRIDVPSGQLHLNILKVILDSTPFTEISRGERHRHRQLVTHRSQSLSQ